MSAAARNTRRILALLPKLRARQCGEGAGRPAQGGDVDESGDRLKKAVAGDRLVTASSRASIRSARFRCERIRTDITRKLKFTGTVKVMVCPVGGAGKGDARFTIACDSASRLANPDDRTSETAPTLPPPSIENDTVAMPRLPAARASGGKRLWRDRCVATWLK